MKTYQQTVERSDVKENSSSRRGSLTGTYSQNGKTEQRSSNRSGKHGKTSTVTEDQHGMTQETSATETREVSHPSHKQGNNLVPSEPLKSKTLDGPLRSQSKSNSNGLSKSKKLSGPKSNSNAQSNPNRRYYKPSDDTKTYFVNSQGHLQSREDPPGIKRQRQTTRQQRSSHLSRTRFNCH